MKIDDRARFVLKKWGPDVKAMHGVRRSLVCIVVLAATLGATNGAGAAEPGRQAGAADKLQGQAPSVEKIIERNAAARGGLQTWRAVAGLSEFGRMETVEFNVVNGTPKERLDARRKVGVASHGMKVPFTMHLQRPHKFYLEIQYNGATGIQVFDGEQGWTVMPSLNGAVAVKYNSDAARAASMQLDLEGPLIDSAAKGTKVTLEGTELLDGRKTYRLKLILRDRQERHLWIDAETFLDTKIDGTRIVGGTAWQVETYFSAYKKVQGLQMPHVLDTSIGGARTTERIIIDHIVVNPVLNDAIFTAPTHVPRQ